MRKVHKDLTQAQQNDEIRLLKEQQELKKGQQMAYMQQSEKNV